MPFAEVHLTMLSSSFSPSNKYYIMNSSCSYYSSSKSSSISSSSYFVVDIVWELVMIEDPVKLLAKLREPLWYRHFATFGFRKMQPILWARLTLAFLITELFFIKLFVISCFNTQSKINLTLVKRSSLCPVLKISTRVYKIPEHLIKVPVSFTLYL